MFEKDWNQKEVKLTFLHIITVPIPMHGVNG